MKKHLKKVAAIMGMLAVPGGLVVATILLGKHLYDKHQRILEEERKHIHEMIYTAVKCNRCTSYMLVGAGTMLKEHLELSHDCSEEFAIKVVAEIFLRFDRIRNTHLT